MVSADAQADLSVHLEAAAGREEAEGGRAQRVAWRQDDASMVHSGTVGRRGRAAQSEVPGEEVGFAGEGVYVGGGGGGELGCFVD